MAQRRQVLRLHVEAQTELQDSVSFYREHGGEALAARFKAHIADAFTAIKATPERFPPARDLKGVQKFRLRHFPFSILFINRPEGIWIVAVAHGSRRPGYWKERLL